MNYQNAAEVLPSELLREIQIYIQGGLLYIPDTAPKKKWGSKNGAKSYYEERNVRIRRAFEKKVTIKELSSQYGLAEGTIKKIIYR